MTMTILTILLAFYIPVCIMIGLYVRVWWETVKRQRELVHLQAGKKASSKRSDSRYQKLLQLLSYFIEWSG